jgi:hypothetical protein
MLANSELQLLELVFDLLLRVGRGGLSVGLQSSQLRAALVTSDDALRLFVWTADVIASALFTVDLHRDVEIHLIHVFSLGEWACRSDTPRAPSGESPATVLKFSAFVSWVYQDYAHQETNSY